VKEETRVPPDKTGSEKRRVPLKEGLFALSSEGGKPQLLAGRCARCGAATFPRTTSCQNCQSKDIATLSVQGPFRLYSFSSVSQRPPGFYYKGEVPYLLGYVELPIGIRIRSLLTGCALEDLKIGMEMELVVEKLHDDEEGNEVATYKFRPER
jgi:hypothetical protein